MATRGSCAEALASQFANGRHVCVGLDPVVGSLPRSVEPSVPPAYRTLAFNRAIIEATASVACAYKPNAAFYEALGQDGFVALAGTIKEVHRLAPDVPVILDAKRADIGSTNQGYVAAAFDVLGADAITVHPYLGHEALSPFLEREEKMVFVLTRTSNPGAGEFQDLVADGIPLYRHVARSVARNWNRAGNCGLVVGATYPTELGQIREDVPLTMPILVPGVGAQGGDVDAVVASERSRASESFAINVSRSVLYASGGRDFAEAAAGAAHRLHARIGDLLGPKSGDPAARTT